MIPGITTRISESVVASADTVDQHSDLLRVTGNTSIATLRPHFAGFSGICIIVPTDANVATLTTGNISLAVTMPVNRATVLVYSKTANLWYPGAIS